MGGEAFTRGLGRSKANLLKNGYFISEKRERTCNAL